jgi:hypothetical protein
MKRKRYKVVKLTYEQQIKKLKQNLVLLEKKIELFEEYSALREYFQKTKKAQNSYIIELRKIIAQEMKDKGFTYVDIGRLFSKDHSTIMSMFKLDSDPKIQKEVLENYKDWMANKVYPITSPGREPSALHPNGWASIIEYKLVKI